MHGMERPPAEEQVPEKEPETFWERFERIQEKNKYIIHTETDKYWMDFSETVEETAVEQFEWLRVKLEQLYRDYFGGDVPEEQPKIPVAPPEAPKRPEYPEGYSHPALRVQAARLQAAFPELSVASMREAPEGELFPEELRERGAEGWFAVPRWQAVAPTYVEATARVFDMLVERGVMHPWRNGMASLDIKEDAVTREAMEEFGRSQNGDYIVFPGQFGRHYRGLSGKQVALRSRSEKADIFPLDPFTIGAMLLAAPERFDHVGSRDLAITCAGAVADPFKEGPHTFMFGFETKGDKVKLTVHPADDYCGICGVPTGWREKTGTPRNMAA